MSSSIGPVNTGKPKFGECRYCFEENHDRDHGFSFEWHYRMRGPICGHKLHKFKSAMIPSRHNRLRPLLLADNQDNYWYRRACLPDFCGEFGEKSLLAFAGMGRMEDDQIAEAIAKIEQMPR